MPSSKDFPCCLCSKRTKPGNRRSLHGVANKDLRKFLSKQFFVEIKEDSVICNKCRQLYYTSIYKNKQTANKVSYTSEHQKKETPATLNSPPSITLPIPSAGGSHSQCFVCKQRGGKLVVIPSKARYDLFLEKEIICPTGARCCRGHLNQDSLTKTAQDLIESCRTTSSFNHAGMMDLLKQLRQIALHSASKRIDFDQLSSLKNSDMVNLTGLTRAQFQDLCGHINGLRDSKHRSTTMCVGILLTKLRTGMSNRLLSTVFNIGKDSIGRAIKSARSALMESFVPMHVGFGHITREEVIQQHTRPLAQTLFGGMLQPVILVIDGTYIYIQKSGQFKFQRRCYSLHKHRPLVKPMMIVTTTGYIVSAIGPYFSDHSNNDANILNHILKNNIEEIRDWLEKEDLVIVDRGFRDSLNLLGEFGIRSEMPSFLRKGQSQHTTEESNTSRLVTKIRWVVESANGRIKHWRFLDHILPTNQVPFIGDYIRIVCAICNKYLPPLSTGNEDKDQILGAKMLHLSKQGNVLQEKVVREKLDKRTVIWKPIDASDAVVDFPKLDEEQLRNLTLGVYQLKLAKLYSREHIDEEGQYHILVHKTQDGLISAKIQSRHTSSKSYQLWIEYSEGCITCWYCKCKSGSRVVGACAHISSVLWYLGFARYLHLPYEPGKDWSMYLMDAKNAPQPQPIDESDDDSIEE